MPRAQALVCVQRAAQKADWRSHVRMTSVIDFALSCSSQLQRVVSSQAWTVNKFDVRHIQVQWCTFLLPEMISFSLVTALRAQIFESWTAARFL